MKNPGHLCQLGHKRDIRLNSGTVPAKPGHLATMDMIQTWWKWLEGAIHACHSPLLPPQVFTNNTQVLSHLLIILIADYQDEKDESGDRHHQWL